LLIENKNDDLKPKILTKLIDCKSEISEKTMFICEYSSLYESKINWYHNGNIIKQSQAQNKYLFHNEPNRSIITILNVRLEDSGIYEFRVQNSYGVSSTTASLTIAQSKIIFIYSVI
jgi:hypothetical protein